MQVVQSSGQVAQLVRAIILIHQGVGWISGQRTYKNQPMHPQVEQNQCFSLYLKKSIKKFFLNNTDDTFMDPHYNSFSFPMFENL